MERWGDEGTKGIPVGFACRIEGEMNLAGVWERRRDERMVIKYWMKSIRLFTTIRKFYFSLCF